MTTTDGVYIEGRRIDTGDCSGPKSARNVLLHPDVDAAVLETARGGVLREGLGFDRCDVAVVTNIGLGDHLGLSYISTVEDLSVVKRVIVQNVRTGTGVAVLNAADPMVVRMAEACPGQRQLLRQRPQPSRDGDAPRAAQAGRLSRRRLPSSLPAAAVEHRIALAGIPLTRNGAIGFPGRERDGGIAAAWALGLDWATIERGLAVSSTTRRPLPDASTSSITAGPR
jgi:cyanophycin synthetase